MQINHWLNLEKYGNRNGNYLSIAIKIFNRFKGNYLSILSILISLYGVILS